ncbi:MAG TPA: 2-phosphosulfolactate phosphatase [Actinomycetes bacterium]|nr:2-phosphosulfolactate phosphatase [Actinomycetes bacterium]
MGPLPPRLVVPSPNGATIATLAVTSGVVVAACLRNARAVGAWLGQRYGGTEAPVTVIAAGERWPDGSLRPAFEDWFGAGAVITSFAEHGAVSLSPDAEAAGATYDGMREGVLEALRRCDSGVELAQAGFGADVELAAAVDVSDAVPVLAAGAFRAS